MTIPSTPLVSIIVPLYNHARYIEVTLESFRTEGYPALEVVILDDGSTDDCFEVARDWLKAHPNAFKNVVLERQENQGITKTLNRLVGLSHGTYITMVASDDLLLPGGIQVRLEALEARPDWLAVFGDATVIDDGGKMTAPSALEYIRGSNKRALTHDDLRALELILRWAVPGPVLLSRREAFDLERGVGGYDETMFIEDRDYYLRLLARRALGFVDHRVAAYRWHARNAIRSGSSIARVYDAVYRAEAQHVTAFSGAEREALEFVTEHSRQNHRRSHGNPFARGMAVFRLLWLEWQLHSRRRGIDVRLAQISPESLSTHSHEH
jgi:glycosyltransferase involved in cell wall biosynthesis